jgi:nitrile hydratase
MLLGIPPEWYKSRAYRSRTVREPRAVLAEFGTRLPDDVDIRVHDSNADMRYMVLPLRPRGTDGWNEERLAALVTRDSLIGVARLPDLA